MIISAQIMNSPAFSGNSLVLLHLFEPEVGGISQIKWKDDEKLKSNKKLS